MSSKSEIVHAVENVIRKGYGRFVLTSINGRMVNVQTRQTILEEFGISE